MSTTMFSGAISSLNKASLVNIATALGLNPNGTVKDLRAKIKEHLDDKKDSLNKDPRFQGLYQYRPSKNAESARKNSAEKATEDFHAAAVPQTMTP